MDCRTFRRKHLAFLDDTLPGVEMVQMEQHRQGCPSCATLDASVRRSLLLLRNLPSIQASADFEARLLHRLAHEARHGRRAEREIRGPSLSVFAGTAASVVALGLLGSVFVRAPEAADVGVPRLPAVVASPARADGTPLDQVAAPAFAASMSTGMPMWPALLLAEEGSVRFATAELEPVSYAPRGSRH